MKKVKKEEMVKKVKKRVQELNDEAKAVLKKFKKGQIPVDEYMSEYQEAKTKYFKAQYALNKISELNL